MEKTKDQLESYRVLFKEQYVEKIKIIELESRESELSTRLDTLNSDIKKYKEQQIENSSMFAKTTESYKLDKSQEYLKVLQDLQEAEGRIHFYETKISRKTITSPVNGVINKIYNKTINSSILGGTPIVEIVPQNTKLIVEAKVNSDDIVYIHPETKCFLRFTAYKARYYNDVKGKVIWVSADSLKDPDGSNNYLIRVEIDQESLKAEGVKELIVGMKANVELLTGEKTIARFLFDPVRMSLSKALKER